MGEDVPANALSEPVITMAPVSLSASSFRSASFNSRKSGVLRALRAFGRFNVTVIIELVPASL
jgi:hypothetical protein